MPARAFVAFNVLEARLVTATNCCGPSRRGVLNGLGGFSLATMLPSLTATAHAAKNVTLRRVDVHHHLAPPRYKAYLDSQNALFSPLKEWSIEKSIEDMEQGDVATAILSITTPDIPLGERNAARAIVRYCNEYAAGLVRDHPGRFGMFAFLPLPDIDGALEEMQYALDTLNADGIGLFTSYEDIWLGDPKLAPLFEELNRRQAVVYTHPAASLCCRNLVPGLPPQMIEYGTDTTRTIASMVFSGAAARYPDIKIIFSHAGGTMPFLIERFDVQERAGKYAPEILPRGARAELQKFFYDTAQSSNAAAMGALRNIVPVSQILFGTDFPYRHAVENLRGLADSRVFSAEDLRAIDQDNVLRILPRLRAS